MEMNLSESYIYKTRYNLIVYKVIFSRLASLATAVEFGMWPLYPRDNTTRFVNHKVQGWDHGLVCGLLYQ